jgi:hypothetical protein
MPYNPQVATRTLQRMRAKVRDGSRSAVVACKFGPTGKLVILTVYAE